MAETSLIEQLRPWETAAILSLTLAKILPIAIPAILLMIIIKIVFNALKAR